MSVFVDTSAFIALLDADDPNHDSAVGVWQDLLERDEALVCTNYVLVETSALAQQRFGLAAVRTVHNIYVPILSVAWLDAASHGQAVTSLLTANRRNLSLVDCASFGTMRRLGISTAFAADRHFREQGFRVLP